MTYSIYTLAQKPELRGQIEQLSRASWPRFLRHSNNEHWHWLFELFADYQLLLCNAADTLIAVGHTVPLIWNGTEADLPATIEETIIRAEKTSGQRQVPNTLSALAAMINAEHRGQNLSTEVIQQMKALARQHACTTLIVPVRPTWKSRYPLTPMQRYVEWRREDGAPLDPWIRVHWRLGAVPLGIAPEALTVEGTVKDWESWTDLVFPESGLYVIPGGLQPVKIEFEQNRGSYEDPNYWMKHTVE